ncbi:S8 family peptidase [Meiothermus ruber]|jgi:subtilisin family serine protease|uniref:Peptidase S8 and S53 subtilisin kexin sedolisin n=1 Tax=Meiothermus ruber (strain ATCC 35948 / DSM 1279 / VKM B-1258 / 21) TaxID=504728 RepID=A0A806DK18_MEIRD|nr:S8 family peptidase [Meiothermus ruber]ADD28284.1 peptidase S8 and S53 subtilisin kexin sedolisin [Meiothermus ruber DSM 1279]MCL6529634.1 S8 family peptidase [Meiothermus ruber]GAO75228.1 aqualysin 1 [Meiothermus ruber H328]
MNRLAWIVLLVLLAACGNRATPDNLAPVLGLDNPNVIQGQYIVVYKDDANVLPTLQSLKAALEGGVTLQRELESLGLAPDARVEQVYTAALQGLAARLSPENLAALRQDPRVAYIEADQVMSISATQTGATWGLDRIDQRTLPLSGTFTYSNTGSGVNAYIIDTGIRVSHSEFGGRATAVFDAIGDGQNGNDCNGHGTHVAGTVGGTVYGVAKSVRLYAVRVLNCSGSGSNSGVIAGVDWVRQNARRPAVANMSLGGGVSSALDTAVSNAINAGITFVLAAGNSNRDACQFSPARVAAGITVGATTSSDTRASYSNYGSCLDLFAPGSSITSAWISSNTSINTISGTSMAAPHVAGVAALYLQSNPTASPATVRNAIVSNATVGVVRSAGSRSPNLLLYSNY